MKSFVFYLTIFSFLLASCTKEEDRVYDIPLKFSKELSFFDAQNNSVSTTIYAKSQEILDFISQDKFRLKVFTKETSKYYNSNSTTVENSPKDLMTEVPNDFFKDIKLYILVNGRNFSSDIVSFTIQPDLYELDQEDNEINVRANFLTVDEIGYGSDGINGVNVEYVLESQPQEYIKCRLSKKTSRHNWFWQRLAQDFLYFPGSQFTYYGGTEWELFRLRIWVYENSGINTCWENPNNQCFIIEWEWLL